MTSTEQEIEQELQEKGLNAPRLNPNHIDAQIVSQEFFTFTGSNYTACLLTLRNGFTVLGENACVSKENWDEQMAHKLSYEDARKKYGALKPTY